MSIEVRTLFAALVLMVGAAGQDRDDPIVIVARPDVRERSSGAACGRRVFWLRPAWSRWRA